MYDTILIGAGYWAVGFCEASGGKNLILSDSVYLDDFSPCLRRAETGFETERGERMHREFQQAGFLRGALADPVQGACWLYQKAEQMDVEILYQTMVSEISDRFVIAHNDEGALCLEAKRVVDLRPRGSSYYWNILVQGKNSDCLEHFNPHYRVLHLPVEGNFVSARRQFETYRLAHPELRYVMGAVQLETAGQQASPFRCYEQGFGAGGQQ
ncbi:MAG: hypothetical protein SO147_02235 [Clostridia bacterium]|nr:hypothetical protein [Clostridia bacterium]